MTSLSHNTEEIQHSYSSSTVHETCVLCIVTLVTNFSIYEGRDDQDLQHYSGLHVSAKDWLGVKELL